MRSKSNPRPAQLPVYNLQGGLQSPLKPASIVSTRHVSQQPGPPQMRLQQALMSRNEKALHISTGNTNTTQKQIFKIRSESVKD